MDKKNLPEIKLYSGKSFDLSKRWHVEWRNEKGKRIKKYGDINRLKTKIARQQAAEKLIKRIEQDLLKGHVSEMEKTAREWLNNQKPFWKKKTYDNKAAILNDLTDWMGFREWNKDNIEDYFTERLMHEKKVSISTWENYRVTVRQILKYLELEHLMNRISKKKFTSTPARYFTKTQKRYVQNAIEEKDPLLYLAVQFVYYCFLRPRSELRLLKIGDIILEDRKILVPTKIAKNKKLQYVSIPDIFYPQVEEYVLGKNPADWLFPGNGEDGTVGYNYFGRKHKKILRELRMDTDVYKMYSWKHTGAVAVVKAGIHIKQLQLQLRHSSLDQVDEYLRQLGLEDFGEIKADFPSIAD
jgi:site-specific recombinase XerD